MNRKRWTVLVLALLIWAGSLLGCRAIARSRVREQYRSYARQALSTEVLSCLHLTDAAIDEALASGELVSCAEIARNFAVAAEMQRVLRNTYLRDEPGGISVSYGVWLSCRARIEALAGAGAEEQAAFFRALGALCKEEKLSFDLPAGDDFEQKLTALEGKLAALLEEYD